MIMVPFHIAVVPHAPLASGVKAAVHCEHAVLPVADTEMWLHCLGERRDMQGLEPLRFYIVCLTQPPVSVVHFLMVHAAMDHALRQAAGDAALPVVATEVWLHCLDERRDMQGLEPLQFYIACLT